MQSVLKGKAGAIFSYLKLHAVVEFDTCETGQPLHEKLFFPYKMH